MNDSANENGSNWWEGPLPKDDVKLWREALKGSSPVISSSLRGLTSQEETTRRRTEKPPSVKPLDGLTESDETETENGY